MEQETKERASALEGFMACLEHEEPKTWCGSCQLTLAHNRVIARRLEGQRRQRVLAAFAAEPANDRATFERYLRESPELAGELIDACGKRWVRTAPVKEIKACLDRLFREDDARRAKREARRTRKESKDDSASQCK